MKKKHRDIVVDNILYAWTYAPNPDKQEGGGELKIWMDKKVIYKKDIDPGVSITPKLVAELISKIHDLGDYANK